MQRILMLFLSVMLTLAGYAQTGEVSGRVVDERGEGVPFASVAVEQDGSVIRGSQSDFDGNFLIRPINPGRYDLRVSFVGYQTELVTGIQINPDRITTVNVEMRSSDQEIEEVVVREFRVPLIDHEDVATKNTITSEEIRALPTRDVQSIASTSAGIYQQDEGGELNIRGARSDGTEIYIDGVRVRGSSNLPAQSIEQMTVITGGVPAKFGDAVGGFVNITTRGASRQLRGGLEVITSEFLDPYGYNLVSFNLTGPILKREDESPILGFFLAGEYLGQRDPRPSAIGVYQLKDDVLDNLERNPLLLNPTGDGVRLRAETITLDDMEIVDVRPNAEENNYRMTGRLDFNLSQNLNLAFGGTYDYTRRRDYVDRYALFNSVNNPIQDRNTWRVFGRFTQTFADGSNQEEESTGRASVQNAFYSIQADFTKVLNKTEGPGIGFNPFDYGYYGKFERHRAPIYEFGTDSLTGQSGLLLAGFRDTLVTFTPGDVNPTATNYAVQFFDLAPDNPQGWYENLDQIQQRRGLINGVRAEIPYGIWYNTGRVINGYGYSNDDEQYRLSFNAAFDIIRPGVVRNRHSIEFGFEFEQRVDRQYSINPLELWTLMRQLTNTHISQLDFDNPEIINVPFGPDTINYPLRYDESEQTHFDRNLRQALGLPVDGTDFINIHAIDPSSFSLDMFSADELLQDGRNAYVSYFGYDHVGNKLNYRPTFEDFFTKRTDEGEFERPVDAFRPIYSAFYVQDKFQFRDILFNVGVRIDRFDANQKVLRDPFSLYAIRSASEVSGELNPSGAHPVSIGGDYAVYVDDFNAENPQILGYRSGNTWFTAEGSETSDATSIARASSTGRITPYLVNPSDNIRSEQFDPNTSFMDYEPQISVMPRISFSFNITDEASFFAHYDILTQRPQSFIRTSPTTWYYFESRTGQILSNPNLRPEKTIDYTLGFRQLVSQTSAVTFSAFYRELRDMVQIVRTPFAYPNEYLTFGNIDFGTVKGLSVAYDLRRTGNVSLKANYTLQFAEGTGSDATSQLSLVNAGQPNLRTIVPLNYDSRHMFNINFDYRYGSGRNYNGPRIGDRDILENSGINIIARGRSGEPYTRQQNATPEALFTVPTRPILQGGINSARLPWNFRLDARIYKSFDLGTVGQVVSEDGTIEKRGNNLNLDVYLLVQNILNTANVIRVYPYTGNPDDDGYLTSPEGREYIAGRANPQSFQDLYRVWIDNPRNYSLPRLIRLGAIFSF